MTNGFGGPGYVSSETRTLSSIEKGAGPDLSQGEAAIIKMLQSHDYQMKFIAGQIKQLQAGVNEATQNPIQQIQQFIADIVVLLGGGQLAAGALDFGDLQYILPAMGALFGFGDGPFPLSLFEAAMKFFVGYVVPQQQFVDVINQIIENWLGLLGIDPAFIADVKELVEAIGNLFDGIGNLFPSLNELLGALGITTAQLGPLGQLLASILRLFEGFDLSLFGNILDFVTDLMRPWIQAITAVINWVNGLLAAIGFGGGHVVNSPLPDLLEPFENLFNVLGGAIFGAGFDPAAWFGDIFGFVEDPISDMWAGMQRLFGIGTNAQNTANNVWREVLDLKGELASTGSGAWFSDHMPYGNAAYLPSPYIVHEDGPGDGTMGPNGNSELAWKAYGASTKVCIYDRPDFNLTSGSYAGAMVVTSRGTVGYGAGAVLGLVNAFGEGVALQVTSNNALLVRTVDAYIPDSTLTADDSTAFTLAAGDRFEIYYGATIGGVAYPDAIVAFRNSVIVWRKNVTGITLGASVYPIIGGFAVPGAFLSQATPPKIGSFAIYDSNLTI